MKNSIGEAWEYGSRLRVLRFEEALACTLAEVYKQKSGNPEDSALYFVWIKDLLQDDFSDVYGIALRIDEVHKVKTIAAPVV